MLSTSSMVMIGKVARWRFVKTDLLVHPVAGTKVVADLEVVWDVEAFVAALVVAEVATEATQDVVATEVEVVAMVVRLPAVSKTVLLQVLPLQHPTPSQTTLHLEEK